jgi:hypothetical protein
MHMNATTTSSSSPSNDTLPLIAQHITAWLGLWRGKRGGGLPAAHGPLSRIDAEAAVLIALRHIMLGGLTMGSSTKVTGLAVAIGRAVEREIGDDGGAGPWGEEVYFRVGMQLLNAIVEVTGRYEFKPDPVHVEWPCRQAPYILAPKAGSEAWLLTQLDARTIIDGEEDCYTATMPQGHRRKVMSTHLSGRGRVSMGLMVAGG